MFHVKHIYQYLISLRLHQILFWVFLVSLPLQTRIIYNQTNALISGEFTYYKGLFLYLSDLILVITLATWLLTDFPGKTSKLKFFKSIIVVGLLPLLALFHVEPSILFVYGWIKWFILVALVWYTVSNFTAKSNYSPIYWVFFISGVAQGLLGILQFHVQHGLGMIWLGEYVSKVGTPGLATMDYLGGKVIRAYGTFPHPNLLGGFLVLSLLCGLFLVSRETLFNKIWASIGLFIIIFGLFFSLSRSAWLAAIIIASAFLIRLILGRRFIAVKLVLILLIVSCGTITLGFRDLIIARSSVTPAVSYRTDYNQDGLSIIKQSPLVGIGVNNYVVAYETTKPGMPAWQYQPAHNVFIVLAAEIGLIGLVALATMIIFLLRFTWNQKSEQALFVKLALLNLLIVGMFDHYLITIQQGRLLLFVVLGLLASTSFVSHETITENQKNRVKLV